MKREITCISCPMGCQMVVEEKDGQFTVTGNTCKNGEDQVIINGNRTLEWKNGQGSGSSEYTIELPKDGDGYQGTLIYTDQNGKEAKMVIDCMPPGDNAIFINEVSYDYIG